MEQVPPEGAVNGSDRVLFLSVGLRQFQNFYHAHFPISSTAANPSHNARFSSGKADAGRKKRRSLDTRSPKEEVSLAGKEYLYIYMR